MQSRERQLNQVAIGISMMLASLVLAGTLLIGFTGLVLLPALGVNPAWLTRVLSFVVRFSVAFGATSAILAVIGPTLCLATPREARATELLLASVAASAVVLLQQILPRFLALPGWMLNTGAMFYVTGGVLFVAFLKRLSKYLDAPEDARLATSTLRLGLVSMVAGVLAFGSLLVSGSTSFATALTSGLATAGLLLVFLAALVIAMLRYIRLLIHTRRSVLQARIMPPETQPFDKSQATTVADDAKETRTRSTRLRFATVISLLGIGLLLATWAAKAYFEREVPDNRVAWTGTINWGTPSQSNRPTGTGSAVNPHNAPPGVASAPPKVTPGSMEDRLLKNYSDTLLNEWYGAWAREINAMIVPDPEGASTRFAEVKAVYSALPDNFTVRYLGSSILPYYEKLLEGRNADPDEVVERLNRNPDDREAVMLYWGSVQVMLQFGTLETDPWKAEQMLNEARMRFATIPKPQEDETKKLMKGIEKGMHHFDRAIAYWKKQAPASSK